ncbi:class I SAM-dependent methyltransferase [Caldicellulosiruptor naganoensis]|uniref:Class I SAM-dependent methyltransferase n=1 Tax=Caldicellulosiruptor naganoensis TaxID=29324 RepID=A0ABY7BGB3_9FIRM|nr:class I SAM-dependent methyltransferase [Caldicellulosiruptor naganoensis]WAM31136.1 class I SAM-dependent methyltransferase [Caldicellulosiruptor naganoensis]
MNFYDNIANYYKMFSNVFFDKILILRFLKKIFCEFDISKRARILDVGCGTGSLLRSLAKMGFEKLYGIDKSTQMIKVACHVLSSANVRLYNEDFLNFEPKNRFDVILSTMDVLNHVDKQRVLKYLKKVRRLLKRNGIFIFDLNTQEYLGKLGKRKKAVKRIEDTLFGWKFKKRGKKIIIDFSVFDTNKTIHDEIIQYIYPEKEIEKMLVKSGFLIVKKIYDYKSPIKTSFCSKVCYVCKKN